MEDDADGVNSLEDIDDVLACTAPWKACGVDSVYSSLIKTCHYQESGISVGEDDDRIEGDRLVGEG